MLAEPPLVLAVGVKVALRVKPLPLIAPNVPPLTITLPVLPSHANVEPGSSLKANVMIAVWPTFKLDASLVIKSVGAVVSMVMLKLLDALLTLPAASVALAVIVCGSALNIVDIMDQLPPVAIALPKTVVPSVSYKVTVAPSSAVPVKVGVVLLVRLSVPEVPLSLPVASAKDVGAAGAVWSSVTLLLLVVAVTCVPDMSDRSLKLIVNGMRPSASLPVSV